MGPELDDDMKIWRYIDLAKLVSMLCRRKLYFASYALLAQSDPYEGLFPEPLFTDALSTQFRDVYQRIEEAKRLVATLEDGANAAQKETANWYHWTGLANEVRQSLGQMQYEVSRQNLRTHFGANCWHANEGESEAMWRLYVALGAGVAIESTVGRLRAALSSDGEIYIGRVRYRDSNEGTDDLSEIPLSLVTKRRSFEHEREIRALMRIDEPGRGCEIDCDLKVLIKTVHISPYANLVLEDAVQLLCSSFAKDYSIDARKSSLLVSPLS